MKTTTINAIEAILKARAEESTTSYKITRDRLMKKYDTCWLNEIMSEDEKNLLHKKKKQMSEDVEIYEDYERHQW